MKLSLAVQKYPIAGTFTIARGSKTSAEVILVELHSDGLVGRGEAVPYARYAETPLACISALERHRTEIEAGHFPDHLPKAAENALDCAVWDLKAKKLNKPVWQLAGLAEPKSKITAFTLSLDTPENMAHAALKANHLPLLKLKLGREGDEARLAKIREAVPQARLIVDANEGWNAQNVHHMIRCCEDHGVELVEQPLPFDQDDALFNFKRNLIICADESAHGLATLPALKSKYDAINIKLDKTGGLSKALELAKAAKAQEFKIMIGCMLATSLAMAPAFLLAQFADYLDLDGPLLLAKDRDPAIKYTNGLMHPPLPSLWG